MSALSLNGFTVRRYDRERFVTTLFAPPEHREALFTLYAFNLEIARIRETVREPLLGQIKLQWWRDNLDAIWEGKVTGHPVCDAMVGLVQDYGLSRALVDQLIAARDLDMTDQPPETLAAFQGYVAGTAGNVVQMAVGLLQGGDESSQQAAANVGQAWGIVGLLRSHAYHIKMRRLYLPSDWLEEQGLDREAIFAGERMPELAHLARHLAELAEDHLAKARALRRQVPRLAQSPLRLALLTDRYLKRLHQTGYDLLDRDWSRTDSRPAALLFASLTGRF